MPSGRLYEYLTAKRDLFRRDSGVSAAPLFGILLPFVDVAELRQIPGM